VKERDCLEGLGIYGRTILNWYYINAMGWIHVAEDWDQWQVVVNLVMNLSVNKMLQVSQLAEGAPWS